MIEHDINDRINLIIAHLKMSVAAFARSINVGDQTVRSVCVMKRNKPSYDFLLRICQTFEWLNPEWLLTGNGNMERDNSQTKACDPNRDLSSLIDYLREKDIKIESLIEEKTSWKVKYELALRANDT